MSGGDFERQLVENRGEGAMMFHQRVRAVGLWACMKEQAHSPPVQSRAL